MQDFEPSAMEQSSTDRANSPPHPKMLSAQWEGMVFQLIDGSIAGCNAAAEKILGFTKEQMQGWTFDTCPWQIIEPSGDPLVTERYPAKIALQTGQPCLDVVLGLYHPNGTLIWLQVNAQPLFQVNEATPYAVVSTFRETAEPGASSHLSQEPSERSLHQNQDLHEAIFNESTDALFLVDPTTLETVDCNQRAVELFEATSKDELIGIQGPTLHRYPFTPEQRNLVLTHMQTGAWIGEIEYVTRQGKPFWGNLATKTIQLGDRAINLVRITDITQQQTALLERQQAEAALHESQAQLQQKLAEIEAIYQSAPIGLNFIDTDLRFVRINQRLAEMNGLPVEAHLGRTVREVLPALADEAELLLRQILETGEPLLNVEIVGETPAQPGVQRTWLESFLPLKDGDRIIGISTVCEEITERKQAEIEREQLLEREQATRAAAEQANRVKDEFLAVLSHELRSPLNPILGWAKLLQTQKLGQDKTQQALGTIERNAKLLVQLIDDLLDMARIMQGKLVLALEPVSLPDVVTAAVETVRFAAESKLLHLEVFLTPALQPIEGDAMRLQQVIWNLLANAVKFTPEHGRILVRLEQSNTHAYIQIEDTGRGISPEFLPHIFERFQQQDTSTARQFGGLGLGLAISRQLVELHGGTITAVSAGEGQGATFTVQLPLMHSLPQSISSGLLTPQPLNLNGVRVLVVDDEPDSLELLKVFLEQEGAIATTVASAEQALKVLIQDSFDVLVSDIGMPKINGYELLRQVRALPGEQNRMIPAIALTAYAGERNQQQAFEAGYHIHLSKPIEPNRLITAIATLTQSS
ncbi:MAG: ATP-binding protein [Oculatellaceae cyanobacterium bins.114]|nr:ATP-binding protein [Oculatellaceae cyanobacterium bins.114]